VDGEDREHGQGFVDPLTSGSGSKAALFASSDDAQSDRHGEKRHGGVRSIRFAFRLYLMGLLAVVFIIGLFQGYDSVAGSLFFLACFAALGWTVVQTVRRDRRGR
jgi:hypothetical protein